MSDKTTDMTREDITEQPARVGRVSRFGEGSVTDDAGWTLGCNTDGLDFPEGALIEQWGKGVGYSVRGLAIDGHVFWYRTEAEDQAHSDALIAASDQRKQDDFERDRTKHDAIYDALPEPFRERIDKFRRTNPDFRWQFEPYEAMCCTDAVKIARYCSVHRVATEADGDEPTAAENVQAFAKLPYEEQKKADIDPGHSGNSFGVAVHLAYLCVTDPGLVLAAHGALTPLVGCKDYGCPHPDAPHDYGERPGGQQ